MKDEQLVKKVSVLNEQKKNISEHRPKDRCFFHLLLVFKEGFSCCVKLIPVCLRFVVCCRKKTCLGQLLKSFYKFLVLTVGHLISYNSCDMHVSSRSNGQMPLWLQPQSLLWTFKGLVTLSSCPPSLSHSPFPSLSHLLALCLFLLTFFCLKCFGDYLCLFCQYLSLVFLCSITHWFYVLIIAFQYL